MIDKLAFVRDNFVLPTGQRVGDALANDRWIETEILNPVFARGEAGLPLYSLVFLELARGHWKTGLGAAVAVTEAVTDDAPTDVIVGAADRDQAALILENVDGYLSRNPLLDAEFVRRGDERIATANGSRIRVISSDAASAWGLGGTHRRFRVIADELTVWRDSSFWEPLVSATGKVPDAQTIVLTNAGFDPGDTSWQWKVRQTAEREPWGYLFSAPGIVASWITPEWVEQMRLLLPPAAFDRVILNRWSSGVGDFVTAQQWAACVDETLRPSGSGRVRWHVAGLDLGLTKDRTALTVVHREDGRVVLDELQVWQGSRKAPLSIATIERALVDVAARYRPLKILVDPWQMVGTVQRLRAFGISVEEFSFGTGSVQRLSTSLYRAVTTSQLRVFPDGELEREVLGLVTRLTPGGWRIDHRAGGFSDRAIALAMAVQGALALPEVPAPPLDPRLLNPLTHDLFDTDGPLGGGLRSVPSKELRW